MPNTPKILEKRTITRTRFFRVEELDLEFSNGTRARYERLKGGRRGAVLVVPLLDRETVLLIREYAAGTDRYEVGFPKGRIEDGEEVLEAANREIMEETGYGAKHLEQLATFSVAPGYIGSMTHVVLAGDLYEKRLPGDEPEEIEVIPWRVDRIDELLRRDDFSEARSIAALYMTRDHLKSGSE
ncbi:MAG: ADP compounds hydrolase NudE [Pseudomonadota bacterium]|nr:ADP compounds hydrolase NudE [Pseudomonadota bacterium]